MFDVAELFLQALKRKNLDALLIRCKMILDPMAQKKKKLSVFTYSSTESTHI